MYDVSTIYRYSTRWIWNDPPEVHPQGFDTRSPSRIFIASLTSNAHNFGGGPVGRAVVMLKTVISTLKKTSCNTSNTSVPVTRTHSMCNLASNTPRGTRHSAQPPRNKTPCVAAPLWIHFQRLILIQRPCPLSLEDGAHVFGAERGREHREEKSETATSVERDVYILKYAFRV
jgi:hypothetical protein